MTAETFNVFADVSCDRDALRLALDLVARVTREGGDATTADALADLATAVVAAPAVAPGVLGVYRADAPEGAALAVTPELVAELASTLAAYGRAKLGGRTVELLVAVRMVDTSGPLPPPFTVRGAGPFDEGDCGAAEGPSGDAAGAARCGAPAPPTTPARAPHGPPAP